MCVENDECCLIGKVKKKVQSALTDQIMLKSVNADTLLTKNDLFLRHSLNKQYCNDLTIGYTYERVISLELDASVCD